MTTTEDKIEDLRKEWIDALKDDSMFMTDVYNETADWWLAKLHQVRTSTLQEAIEAVENLVKTNDMSYMFPATEERFLNDLKIIKKQLSSLDKGETR